MRFVRGVTVLAVIPAIAHLILWNALEVRAGELVSSALRVLAVDFVAVISTVVLVVALPLELKAATVRAAELRRRARMNRTVLRVFVRSISAVVISVASVPPIDAFAIGAGELRRVTRDVLGHAHLALVGHLHAALAETLGPVWARVTRLGTAAVVQLAYGLVAFLPFRRVDVNVSR